MGLTVVADPPHPSLPSGTWVVLRDFLRYGLALAEREPPGVTGLDLSRVYHHPVHVHRLDGHLVVLPQAMRIMVPPLANQYLNTIKNTTLAVLIGYPDLVSVANTIINQTGQAIEGILIIMAILSVSQMITGTRWSPPIEYVPIWKDPWMWCGGDTYVSALVTTAGGQNVLADRQRYPTVSLDPGPVSDTLPATNNEERTSSERRSMHSRTRFAPDVIDRTRRQR